MKKLISFGIALSLFCMSVVSYAAACSTTISGGSIVVPSSIAHQITPYNYLQFYDVQLRTTSGVYVRDITDNQNPNQSAFNNPISFGSISNVPCGEYNIIVMYQIYKVGRNAFTAF